MARQARIEYPGPFSTSVPGQAIFLDVRHRIHFLALLAEAVRHYGWLLTAWVLMTNHFHLVLETPEPNLSSGMKWFPGTYVGCFNNRLCWTPHHGTRRVCPRRRHGRRTPRAPGTSPAGPGQGKGSRSQAVG
jgi:hypothetical protein